MSKNINKSFKDNEKNLWIEEHFPLLEVLDDNLTITTKEGQIVQVIKLAGMDYTGRSYSVVDDLASQRQKFFENIPDDVSLTVHYQRKQYQHDSSDISTDNVYVNEIFKKRSKEFQIIYKTDIFIVISKKITPFGSTLGIASKNFEAEILKIQHDAKELTRTVKQIIEGLKDYKPSILLHSSEGKSELLSFWSYLINGGNTEVIIPRKNTGLSYNLPCTDIEFLGGVNKSLLSRIGDYMKAINVEEKSVAKTKSFLKALLSEGNHQYCVFYDNNNSHYGAFISIKDFPDKTTAELLDNIMTVKRKFNIVQRITPIPLLKAQSRLEKRRHNTKELSKYGRFQLEDMHSCLEFLSSEGHKLLDYDLMVCIYGDSIDELDQGVAEILNAFVPVQIVGLRERAHIPSAFWSQFPDNEDLNMPRRYMLSSINVADMINFSTKGAGNLKCAFGNHPVDFFKTPDGQSYGFTFHPNESKTVAGHTLILGGTGRGKTVLMNHLNTCCRKYDNMKTLVIDSYNGMNITVEMLGGIYNSVDKGLELNPMQLPDNTKNRAFLERFISVLVDDVDEQEKQEIIEALELNYSTLKHDERSLHAIRGQLGVPTVVNNKANLISRLQKWLPDADNVKNSKYKYGQFFNADKDSLSFDNPIVGFDFTDILDNEELKIPLSMYIFHAFTEAIDRNPAPHICFWDETLKFIKDDRMFKFIRTALLEWRKRNGVFVGAVQDPNLLTGMKNGEDFLRSFETYIIFPDPNADPSVYMGDDKFGGIGITDTEFDWIKSSSNKYEVMIKRKEGGSTIININLSGLGEHLTLLRSEADLVRNFKNMKERHKNESNWIDNFIKTYGDK